MLYRVTVNVPGKQQGQELEVPGLGVVENGSATEVELSEEEAQKFASSSNFEIIASDGQPVEPATQYDEEPAQYEEAETDHEEGD